MSIEPPDDYIGEPLPPEPVELTTADLYRPDLADPGYRARKEQTVAKIQAIAWGIVPPELSTPAHPDPLGPEATAALLAAGPDVPSGSGRLLPFRTAREVVTETPPDWEYIVRPWIAAGSITELDGKPKAAGKTTWLLHLIASALDGRPFLGEPTMRTPVVLLTEQSRRSLAPILRTLGLERDELVILSWPDTLGADWPTIAAAAVAECARIGARLLAVDTLGQFAGIRGDSENDAGAALAAMAPLQAATADGLAVLVSRHDRKGGGEVGESGRGSNAWTGAVDCVINLRRQPNPVRPTIRELEAISRRSDVPPDPVVIEWTEAGYIVLGSEAAVAHAEAKDRILGLLADGATWTEREALDALPDLKRTTWQETMAALVAAGTVERQQRQRVNEPYRYRLADPAVVLLPDLRKVRAAADDAAPSADPRTRRDQDHGFVSWDGWETPA